MLISILYLWVKQFAAACYAPRQTGYLGVCRIYREAVRDYSPGLLGLGFCHKELALKGRPNAMGFRHGSQGIHFHPYRSVALSGRISMELSQA